MKNLNNIFKMSKYKVFFGTHIGKTEPSNIEELSFMDTKDNKTIKNLKNFITCYNDELCTCMLKYYTFKTNLFGKTYQEYEGNDENELSLKKAQKEKCIAIMKIKKECDCGFLNKKK